MGGYGVMSTTCGRTRVRLARSSPLGYRSRWTTVYRKLLYAHRTQPGSYFSIFDNLTFFSGNMRVSMLHTHKKMEINHTAHRSRMSHLAEREPRASM